MTRDDILQAAAQIFREKGYHAASMQDIAEAVELQKGSLYHHVSSKQGILLALLDQALDILTAELEEVCRGPLPPEQKLRRAIQTYLNILTENISLSSVLLLEHRSLKPENHQAHIPPPGQVRGLMAGHDPGGPGGRCVPRPFPRSDRKSRAGDLELDYHLVYRQGKNVP